MAMNSRTISSQITRRNVVLQNIVRKKQRSLKENGNREDAEIQNRKESRISSANNEEGRLIEFDPRKTY